MSSEVKRTRSTICRDLYDTSNCNPSWDRLPLEMAVHIYQFLQMNEKFNMSLTCKLWCATLRHPGTWQKSHFLCTRRTQREIPYVVLSSLQYVTIDCSVSRYNQKPHRVVDFVQGLTESKNTALKKLEVLNRYQLQDTVMLWQLHRTLRTLLSQQTMLLGFSLQNAKLQSDQALALLTAVGQNSAQCLKNLNLINFTEVTSPLQEELNFARTIGAYTNITELSINLGFVSDALLNHLSSSLKIISVWVHWFDLGWFDISPTYSDNGWSVLVSKCTGLKAKYHVEDTNGFMEKSPSLALLPAVPLAAFYWVSRGGPQNIFMPCFEEVINTFKNGLEVLCVDVDSNFLTERDVVAVVER